MIGILAFNSRQVNFFSEEGSTVILRKDIDHAPAGNAFSEMNAIFQCGLEQLLKRIVDNCGHSDDMAVDSHSTVVQMSYGTLYNRLKTI